MTTVFTAGSSEGERRCDAKCHDATAGDCDCICGGRYHGVGKQVLDLVRADIEAGVVGRDPAITITEAVRQRALELAGVPT